MFYLPKIENVKKLNYYNLLSINIQTHQEQHKTHQKHLSSLSSVLIFDNFGLATVNPEFTKYDVEILCWASTHRFPVAFLSVSDRLCRLSFAIFLRSPAVYAFHCLFVCFVLVPVLPHTWLVLGSWWTSLSQKECSLRLFHCKVRLSSRLPHRQKQSHRLVDNNISNNYSCYFSYARIIFYKLFCCLGILVIVVDIQVVVK